MKSIIEKSNKASKANKRSQALKSILEKQDKVQAAKKINQTLAIADIKEDGIECGTKAPNLKSHVKVVSFDTKIRDQAKASSIIQSIELFNHLIAKELANAATTLGIDEAELQAWIDLQIEVPAKTILNLLRSMQSLHLDPLCEEINFIQYDDGQWQVLITIEGCSKLLNQHPQFNGLIFTQADTLIDGVPEWIECAIYRKDREVPTTVREYLTEVRGENEIWRKMPRRMLRHRALQQCVRLAIA